MSVITCNLLTFFLVLQLHCPWVDHTRDCRYIFLFLKINPRQKLRGSWGSEQGRPISIEYTEPKELAVLLIAFLSLCLCCHGVLGVILTAHLNHNTGRKDTCRSVRQFTQGKLLLRYLAYTWINVQVCSAQAQIHHWHWLTFTHTQPFTPPFLLCCSLTLISLTHTHRLLFESESKKRGKMGQIM